MSGVLFGLATGTDLVHVPYTSAVQAVRAVMTDEVTMGFFNTPLVIEYVRHGELRALGVTSRERSSLLPNVPTLAEQGVEGCEMRTWAGFFAPVGTPPEIVRKLNAEFSDVFASQEAKAKLASQGFELSTPMTPPAISRLVADDLARWLPVVKASGARVN